MYVKGINSFLIINAKILSILLVNIDCISQWAKVCMCFCSILLMNILTQAIFQIYFVASLV